MLGPDARIAIIGAGLMGHGLAQVFSSAGHRVRVFDAVPAAIDTLHARIEKNLVDLGLPTDGLALVSGHLSLEETVADADFVTEAVAERVEIKRAMFADLERLAPPAAVLASNTSVIPIGSFTGGLVTRRRMLGTHWWNPPFLVPLVEVIKAADTDVAVVDAVFDLLARIGKTPVKVMKDVPGFVGNRLQHALWREAIALIADGVCDAETVDTVVKASFGRRLPVLGPIANADLVGTDLTLAIHESVLAHLDKSTAPSRFLMDLVAAGRLGVKSGQGFLDWPPGKAEGLRAEVFNELKARNSATSSRGRDT